MATNWNKYRRKSKISRLKEGSCFLFTEKGATYRLDYKQQLPEGRWLIKYHSTSSGSRFKKETADKSVIVWKGAPALTKEDLKPYMN